MEGVVRKLIWVLVFGMSACSGGGDQGDTGVSYPLIWINELQAANVSTLEDNGTFPDWVELYNPGTSDALLDDYALSDDADDPLKWTFSGGGSVPAGGYLIVFCDSDPDEGVLHTTYNLDQLGEDVVLSAPDGTELDIVSYPLVADDFSYGRIPDGSADWEVMTPSPNAPNTQLAQTP